MQSNNKNPTSVKTWELLIKTSNYLSNLIKLSQSLGNSSLTSVL